MRNVIYNLDSNETVVAYMLWHTFLNFHFFLQSSFPFYCFIITFDLVLCHPQYSFFMFSILLFFIHILFASCLPLLYTHFFVAFGYMQYVVCMTRKKTFFWSLEQHGTTTTMRNTYTHNMQVFSLSFSLLALSLSFFYCSPSIMA